MKFKLACKYACDNSNKRIIAPITKRLLMVVTGDTEEWEHDCLYPENGRLASVGGKEMDSKDWKVFDVETKAEIM